MLNLISYRLLDYLLRLPWIQKEGRADPISKSVPEQQNCRGCWNGSTRTCACMPASS